MATHMHLLALSVFWFSFILSLVPCSVRFKEHLNSHELKAVLSPEEYQELRTLCRQSQKVEQAEQTQEDKAERPPGEEEPATPEDTDTVSSI